MITPAMSAELWDAYSAAETREAGKEAQRLWLEDNHRREQALYVKVFGDVETAREACRAEPSRYLLEHHEFGGRLRAIFDMKTGIRTWEDQ